MTTFALVALTLMATLLAAAVIGRWWLRRLVMTPVSTALATGGSPCDGCTGSQAMLMAAADGGQGASGGSGGPSGGAAKKKRGPDRRTFLRGALGLSAFGALGGFGAASIAFLWPNIRGGFGAVFEVASEEEVLAEIDEGGGQFAFRPARALLVRYDPAEDPDGQYAALVDDSTQIMALYQVCVHLGCTVPWCETSRWWECPCHGSQYNRWGEWQDGPAPRGLDRFRTSVDDNGVLLVDTSEIITGPARQQQALDQPPDGPHCT